MIPRTFTRIQWNKMINIKNCQSNCQCTNRLKILSVKTPLNIIDDVFIKFQIKEQMKEYDECYNKKLYDENE